MPCAASGGRMHCASPSTSPKDVCRLQGAVPVSTIDSAGATVLVVAGVPSPELQLTENTASAAREVTIGSRESMRASVYSLQRALVAIQVHSRDEAWALRRH